MKQYLLNISCEALLFSIPLYFILNHASCELLVRLHLHVKTVAIIYISSIKSGFTSQESPLLFDGLVPLPVSLYGPRFPCEHPYLLPVLFSPHGPSALPFSFDERGTVLASLSPGPLRSSVCDWTQVTSLERSSDLEIRSRLCYFSHGCVL